MGKVWVPKLTHYKDETHIMGNVWGNPYFSHTMGIFVSHTMGKVWVPKLTKNEGETQTMGNIWENPYFSHTMGNAFPILWEFSGNLFPYYGKSMGTNSHTMGNAWVTKSTKFES